MLCWPVVQPGKEIFLNRFRKATAKRMPCASRPRCRATAVFWQAGSVASIWTLAVALACAPSTVAAQSMPANPEPPAVAAQQAPAPAADSATPQDKTAIIAGTVLNAAGAEVGKARVVLEPAANTGPHSALRVLRTNGRGEFTFRGVPAGQFKIAASARHWGTYISPPIRVAAGDFRIVTGIVLPVATSTSVKVFGNPEVLAEQQVHIAEQQRVLRVFPNFYTSYDWNAPPLQARQKFQLAFRSLIDPITFVAAASVAGMEQYVNRFPDYGSGPEGYMKRFGAAYLGDWSGRMLTDAVFPSLFHQDPRYFYRASGSPASRALYAVEAAVIARSDKGHWEPSYSRICGSFTAAAISNLYTPAANRGASLVLTNGLIGIASDAGTNLVREFVLKKLTSRAHARP